MIKKKIKFLAFILSMFSITFSFAQGGGDKNMTPEQRADNMISRMDQKLKLTADQKTKLKQIFVDSNKQEEEYRKEANGDREKFKQLSATSRKTREDAVKAVLTPEQAQEWEKEKAEHQQNH
jgi:hypothetical protein